MKTTPADRKVFDAMRTACEALGVTVDEIERLDVARLSAAYDAFAEFYRLVRSARGIPPWQVHALCDCDQSRNPEVLAHAEDCNWRKAIERSKGGPK